MTSAAIAGSRRWAVLGLVCAAALGFGAPSAHAARLAELVDIDGVRDNQIYGIGIVVGLNGTGDRSPASKQMLANVYRRLGLRVTQRDVKSDNVAAVLITATLPPFARPGQRIDVNLSTIGDAKSLFGGTLLQAPLEGADGQVYAVAQGSLSVGGFSFGGQGASAQRNHPTVARIPGGALVEREVPMHLVAADGRVRLLLRTPSFRTAERVAAAVTEQVGASARALDAAAIEVLLPTETLRERRAVPFVAKLLDLEVEPDTPAKVVINERTGTIVAGERVEIGTVVISHGNLTVTVTETPVASQPPALSGGSTEVLPRTQVKAAEQGSHFVILRRTTTVGDLAAALNALGGTPRDIIAIFQAIERAGALRARLEIM
ncbi:MAG: flagellar basal body P-ring protein FlgI [Planctomycetota bacterium]|nr:MAG: flagellar basal body P-ring protein FlgI [Planctomycetota bacterium]